MLGRYIYFYMSCSTHEHEQTFFLCNFEVIPHPMAKAIDAFFPDHFEVNDRMEMLLKLFQRHFNIILMCLMRL